MDLKLLHLRNARIFAATTPSNQPENPNRRSFIKTMGIGVFAVNPIAETIKSINFNPFEIRLNNNHLTVTRFEKVVWEFSDQFFEPNYNLKLISGDHTFQILANNLQVRSTELKFSLIANIAKENNIWMMQVEIPELSVHGHVNFLSWLDKSQTVNSTHDFKGRLTGLDDSDSIELNGNCLISLSSEWNIAI